jgi:hypothetical protein
MAVAVVRLTDWTSVDGDEKPVSAHGMVRHRKYTFDQGNIGRQIASFREERRKLFGRIGDDKVARSQSAGGPDGVEADWSTLGYVPDETRHWLRAYC